MFEGTVAVEADTFAGEVRSAEVSAEIEFFSPEVFSVEPNEVSVGQYVRVIGAGFLSGDATTVLRITGDFEAPGGSTETITPVEFVPEVVNSNELRFVIDAAAVDGALESTLFGAASGDFSGRFRVSVEDDTHVTEASPIDLDLHLSTPIQVVQLRFLTGFYQSLERFGLGAASSEITQRVADRVSELYADYAVDIRSETPMDFGPQGYSVLEIGGPDPNGLGLLGYDNSPGKDVGNVRLFDAIGGSNAETQDDGAQGYGGVFIDTLLYWSSHPELPGARPAGAPAADPLFDEVFDGVRAAPALPSEIAGEADLQRLSEIGRAIRALGNVIGETAAHEIGHSLGLANPYGPSDVYHNAVDSEGCLMDAGVDRPFGERADEPEFADTEFCLLSRDYLRDILPGSVAQ